MCGASVSSSPIMALAMHLYPHAAVGTRQLAGARYSWARVGEGLDGMEVRGAERCGTEDRGRARRPRPVTHENVSGQWGAGAGVRSQMSGLARARYRCTVRGPGAGKPKSRVKKCIRVRPECARVSTTLCLVVYHRANATRRGATEVRGQRAQRRRAATRHASQKKRMNKMRDSHESYSVSLSTVLGRRWA